MPSKKRCCASCVFARVTFTPKGRITRNTAAKCVVDVPLPDVPPSLQLFTSRIYMDPQEPRDDCSFYERGAPSPK